MGAKRNCKRAQQASSYPTPSSTPPLPLIPRPQTEPPPQTGAQNSRSRERRGMGFSGGRPWVRKTQATDPATRGRQAKWHDGCLQGSSAACVFKSQGPGVAHSRRRLHQLRCLRVPPATAAARDPCPRPADPQAGSLPPLRDPPLHPLPTRSWSWTPPQALAIPTGASRSPFPSRRAEGLGTGEVP